MTPAAGTAAPVRRPAAVRVLTWLLGATAVATVAVEVLNWAYAPEGGYGLAVRTSWALLRSVGFLFLIWHVRAGRPGAKPFGLILAITTVFAVGRLVVPRSGEPALPGLAGFAVLVGLCAAVVVMLYRSPAVAAHLDRPATRLVLRRDGLWRRPKDQAPSGKLSRVPAERSREPVSGWLLTARVAAFAYSPLMIVPSLVAIGTIADGRIDAVPAVVLWFTAGVVVSHVVLFLSIFLVRGKAWPRALLVAVTIGVLLLHLPLCWWLLGVDGLVRDGGPLMAAAVLALYALRRAARR